MSGLVTSFLTVNVNVVPRSKKSKPLAKNLAVLGVCRVLFRTIIEIAVKSKVNVDKVIIGIRTYTINIKSKFGGSVAHASV